MKHKQRQRGTRLIAVMLSLSILAGMSGRLESGGRHRGGRGLDSADRSGRKGRKPASSR